MGRKTRTSTSTQLAQDGGGVSRGGQVRVTAHATATRGAPAAQRRGARLPSSPPMAAEASVALMHRITNFDCRVPAGDGDQRYPSTWSPGPDLPHRRNGHRGATRGSTNCGLERRLAQPRGVDLQINGDWGWPSRN